MSFRYAGFLLVLALVFFLPAPAAHAQACADGCYQNIDDGFTGWDDSGVVRPPTTTKCVASASLDQQCRACRTSTTITASLGDT
jgi:hypothetical protein